MLDQSIGEHENRYMLATVIGKRAVQLYKGSETLIDCESKNNVTIAICEYRANKLRYVVNKNVKI